MTTSYQWLHDIVDGINTDVLMNTDEHALIYDEMWDRFYVKEVHLLSIVKDKSIRSIRDLTQKHIEMLERIEIDGKTFIQNKYGFKPDEICAFIHYPPTYWHLHIHFTHVTSPLLCSNRIFSIKRIITNLKIEDDYYKRHLLPPIVFFNPLTL